MNRWIFCILLSGLLLGCSNEEKDGMEDIKLAIEENQLLWLENGLSDYVFTYRRSPQDCPNADETPVVEIHVEDNQVVEVYLAPNGTPLAITNEPTIDEIFILMKVAALTSPVQFSATKIDTSLPTFSADLGYPISFYVDLSTESCDAFLYSISNFN